MWCRFVLAVGFCAAANVAGAQSFNCTQAQTRVEKMVCADRAIADLDDYLGRYYAAARTVLRGAAACLQFDQAQWLKATRDVCADGACLKSAYLNRLAELDPLQPGATALKNVEWPPVPALVWVVPPAEDTVAAPPNPKAKPYEAVGAIVDDIGKNPTSEGFTMRLKDGTLIPLMMLMFLEAETQDRLTVLAKDRSAIFRARGYAASDRRGRLFFEPSRCVFVHRMPAVPSKPGAEDPEQQMEQVSQEQGVGLHNLPTKVCRKDD